MNIKLSPDASGSTAAATPDTATNIATVATTVIADAAPFAAAAGPYGAEAVAVATLALAGYKALLPVIENLVNKGLITTAQQSAVLSAYTALDQAHAAAFSGPEWKPD